MQDLVVSFETEKPPNDHAPSYFQCIWYRKMCDVPPSNYASSTVFQELGVLKTRLVFHKTISRQHLCPNRFDESRRGGERLLNYRGGSEASSSGVDEDWSKTVFVENSGLGLGLG